MGSLAIEGARLAEVFRVAPSFFAVFRGPNFVYEFVNEAYMACRSGGTVSIDPTVVISHILPLADAPKGYDMFVEKKDNCEKVVLKA